MSDQVVIVRIDTGEFVKSFDDDQRKYCKERSKAQPVEHSILMEKTIEYWGKEDGCEYGFISV
jgi:hypothetical protein